MILELIFNIIHCITEIEILENDKIRESSIMTVINYPKATTESQPRNSVCEFEYLVNNLECDTNYDLEGNNKLLLLQSEVDETNEKKSVDDVNSFLSTFDIVKKALFIVEDFEEEEANSVKSNYLEELFTSVKIENDTKIEEFHENETKIDDLDENDTKIEEFHENDTKIDYLDENDTKIEEFYTGRFFKDDIEDFEINLLESDLETSAEVIFESKDDISELKYDKDDSFEMKIVENVPELHKELKRKRRIFNWDNENQKSDKMSKIELNSEMESLIFFPCSKSNLNDYFAKLEIADVKANWKNALQKINHKMNIGNLLTNFNERLIFFIRRFVASEQIESLLKSNFKDKTTVENYIDNLLEIESLLTNSNCRPVYKKGFSVTNRSKELKKFLKNNKLYLSKPENMKSPVITCYNGLFCSIFSLKKHLKISDDLDLHVLEDYFYNEIISLPSGIDSFLVFLAFYMSMDSSSNKSSSCCQLYFLRFLKYYFTIDHIKLSKPEFILYMKTLFKLTKFMISYNTLNEKRLIFEKLYDLRIKEQNNDFKGCNSFYLLISSIFPFFFIDKRCMRSANDYEFIENTFMKNEIYNILGDRFIRITSLIYRKQFN